MSCCGKTICSGCIYAVKNINDLCPFCRIPPPNTHKKVIEQIEKRINNNDPSAIYGLGSCYFAGLFSVPQNRAKALELYHRAGELGNGDAYFNIGNAYMSGVGVERDHRKAKHYYELAAIKGHVVARYNLGVYEKGEGFHMIAARDGDSVTLENMKRLSMEGRVSKDDYEKAVQSYRAYLDEIKSAQRDEAASYDSDQYRYYDMLNSM